MSTSTRRLIVLTIAGLVAGGVCAALAPWQLAVLGGWIAGAAVYLVTVWMAIARADGTETQRSSTAEDDSRTARGLIMVSASVGSLAGAGFALHKASQVDGGGEAAVLTAAALTTVVVSWLAVHTDFTLRYAHLYYMPPSGGVEFAGVDLPNYRDFAYLAFTVGMTYQVSDTGLLAVRFRRVLLKHALVSYVFGAVIIASAINIVAGLVN